MFNFSEQQVFFSQTAVLQCHEVHRYTESFHNMTTHRNIKYTTRQGSDTRVIPPKNRQVFSVKPIEKKQQKPTSISIQFQFVTEVVIKDFFMFTASNNQQDMNL